MPMTPSPRLRIVSGIWPGAFLLSLALVAAGCMGPGAGDAQSDVLSAAEQERALALGRSAMSGAFARLSGELGRAVAEGGVPGALRFCSVEAVPLTNAAARASSAGIRRFSHRPRNPANAADAVQGRMIAGWQAAIAGGGTPGPDVQAGGSTVVFRAPIVLNNPLCLQCHGEPGRDIAPENLALIRSLYPRDQAVGFRMGDIRGGWEIRLDRKALASAP